jgi:hypothetical protein
VLIESAELRKKLAKASFERVRAYSWQRCARETLGFLAEVAGMATNRHRHSLACAGDMDASVSI